MTVRPSPVNTSTEFRSTSKAQLPVLQRHIDNVLLAERVRESDVAGPRAVEREGLASGVVEDPGADITIRRASHNKAGPLGRIVDGFIRCAVVE